VKCKRCNTTTGASGVCPHCGWSPSGADAFQDRQPEADQGETGPTNLALTQRPRAIELVDVEVTPTLAAPGPGGEAPGPVSANTAGALQPAVLALICGAPERLEAGLRPVREGHLLRWRELRTEVGPIDLLLRDRDGAWVVVVFSYGDSALVDEVLQRVGWVRKHLARSGEGVRAIVLIPPDEPPPHYAAAALAGTVTFKTWRLEVHVEEVAF